MDPDLAPSFPLGEIIEGLRGAGVRFAFVHGSHARGTSTPDSDLDVAAYFGGRPDLFEVLGAVGDSVDLLVLDDAPLELAGRIALHGILLFEEDPGERVEWQAATRKIYLDERPRIDRARRDFVEARAGG